MTHFAFSRTQTVSISAALVADELARQFGRYTETFTLSKWSDETKVGAPGIGVSTDQAAALAIRVCRFFGQADNVITPKSSDTLGDWAGQIESAIRQSLTMFRFHPSSTQGGDAESRHPADEIYQDAAAVASLMRGRRRVVSLVSAHSLVGLVSSVIAPNLLGLEVVDARRLSPDVLASQLTFGDIVIATPSLWRYLSDTLEATPSNVMGISFGERLAVELSGRLRQRGLGAMRELYGSTETGVVAWRDTPTDPFTLFDHWQRKDNQIIRDCPGGDSRALLPMDELTWQGPRSFELGDRRDGAVQIGAVNVFPQAIAALIAEHPSVEKCDVRVSQRAGALDRLIAKIKLIQTANPDEAMAWSIDEWCRQRLRPAERPRIYTFYPFTSDESLD